MQIVLSEQCLTFKNQNEYTVEIFIVFCYDYKHLPFSNKRYQPEMNFMDYKYLAGLVMSCPGFFLV